MAETVNSSESTMSRSRSPPRPSSAVADPIRGGCPPATRNRVHIGPKPVGSIPTSAPPRRAGCPTAAPCIGKAKKSKKRVLVLSPSAKWTELDVASKKVAANSGDPPDRSGGSRDRSGGSQGIRSGSPDRSAASPDFGDLSPLRSVGSPDRSAGSPDRSAGSPGRSAVRSAGSPDRSRGPPVPVRVIHNLIFATYYCTDMVDVDEFYFRLKKNPMHFIVVVCEAANTSLAMALMETCQNSNNPQLRVTPLSAAKHTCSNFLIAHPFRVTTSEVISAHDFGDSSYMVANLTLAPRTTAVAVGIVNVAPKAVAIQRALKSAILRSIRSDRVRCITGVFGKTRTEMRNLLKGLPHAGPALYQPFNFDHNGDPK
jgi:hypothetical protein